MRGSIWKFHVVHPPPCSLSSILFLFVNVYYMLVSPYILFSSFHLSKFHIPILLTSLFHVHFSYLVLCSNNHDNIVYLQKSNIICHLKQLPIPLCLQHDNISNVSFPIIFIIVETSKQMTLWNLIRHLLLKSADEYLAQDWKHSPGVISMMSTPYLNTIVCSLNVQVDIILFDYCGDITWLFIHHQLTCVKCRAINKSP